jgi:hypothetical protein
MSDDFLVEHCAFGYLDISGYFSGYFRLSLNFLDIYGYIYGYESEHRYPQHHS